MSPLALTRSGAGEPLVLLHGIGSSRQAWDPVVRTLAERLDVVAVDLPGFGASASLPPDVEPTPRALARAVADALDELGLDHPHVAGNSLGGWVALELAALRPVASLTLLSPAGLWGNGAPLYSRASLRATRWLAQHATRTLDRLVARSAGRAVVFAQVVGRPGRMTPAQAHGALHAMADCPGFEAVLRATSGRRCEPDAEIAAPVTVAFGGRDRLLPRRQARRIDLLPAGTRTAQLPGCGHLPMTDDPEAVAALILATAGQVSGTRSLGSVLAPQTTTAIRSPRAGR